MEVAIFDQDILLHPKKVYPSLEAMKISSYHKQKKDIVRLLIDARDFERFNKLYVIKNIKDNDYPKWLLSSTNSEFYGLAFGNNNYFPLPDEIEKCQPDKSLYQRYYKENIKNNVLGIAQETWFNSNLIRLYPKGIYIKPQIIQNKTIIYDNNIGQYPNYQEVLTDLSKQSKISFLKDLTSNNLQEIQFYSQLKNLFAIEIAFNGIPTLEQLEFLLEVSAASLYPIYINYFQFLFEKPSFKLVSIYYEQILNIIFYLYSIGQHRKLMCYQLNDMRQLNNPDFYNIMAFTCLYSTTSMDKTMMDYAKYLKGKVSNHYYETLNKFLEYNKNLRILFNTNPQIAKNKGGIWRYDK